MIVVAHHCRICGRDTSNPRAATCSVRCRVALFRADRRRFAASVTCATLGLMRIEPASMTRVEVSELLGIAPMAVRQLETNTASGFPRGIEIRPCAPRWRRSEVAQWAARNLPAELERVAQGGR